MTPAPVAMECLDARPERGATRPSGGGAGVLAL